LGFLDSLRGNKKDPYVDSCFDFNFRESPEKLSFSMLKDREEIFSPVMNGSPGNNESYSIAIASLENQLKFYPSHEILYIWLGFCQKKLFGSVEARKTYLEGIEKSRERALICQALAKLDFEDNNLSDAVKWWIRCCAIEAINGREQCGFSFICLAKIAKFLGLKKCYSKLSTRGAWIKSSVAWSNSLFDKELEPLELMVNQQRNDSIAKAITKLCKEYSFTFIDGTGYIPQ
jgi:hypothetical protein